MSKQQIHFLLPEDAAREFARHVEDAGATKSGVLRSLIHDWMEWRREILSKKLKEAEAQGRTVDWEAGRIEPAYKLTAGA